MAERRKGKLNTTLKSAGRAKPGLSLTARMLAAGLLLLTASGAFADQCEELRRCCTAIHREMLASGLTVPASNQCDMALRINDIARSHPGMPPCQELLIYYREWAWSLWQEGHISLVPPACGYGEPGFEMESEPPDFEMESEPPDFEMESTPPDFEMESEPATESEMIFTH